jgi:hypothetical protein
MKAATKSHPPLSLSVNAIFNGRFVFAGTVLDQQTLSTLPATFKKYLVPAESESDQESEQPVANFQRNTSYRVDREGRLLARNLERQVTEQVRAAQFQDAVEQQLQDSLENPDEQTKAALEVVADNHRAAVGLEMAQRAYAAKEREATDQAARDYIAEQDAMLIDENPVSPTIEEQIPQPESEWKPQPRKMRVRFLCRNGVWLRAKRVKNLKIGESVFVRNGPGNFVEVGKVNSKKHLPVIYLED